MNKYIICLYVSLCAPHQNILPLPSLFAAVLIHAVHEISRDFFPGWQCTQGIHFFYLCPILSEHVSRYSVYMDLKPLDRADQSCESLNRTLQCQGMYLCCKQSFPLVSLWCSCAASLIHLAKAYNYTY